MLLCYYFTVVSAKDAIEQMSWFSLMMIVCSVSYHILLWQGAESPQKDTYNGHMIVASCHVQTWIPQLETERHQRLTFNQYISKYIFNSKLNRELQRDSRNSIPKPMKIMWLLKYYSDLVLDTQSAKDGWWDLCDWRLRRLIWDTYMIPTIGSGTSQK